MNRLRSGFFYEGMDATHRTGDPGAVPGGARWLRRGTGHIRRFTRPLPHGVVISAIRIGVLHLLESLVRNHIALADRHLREAEERIEAQRVRVAKATGEEWKKAEALLVTFSQIRDQMQVHRDLLDEVLRQAVLCSPSE